MTEPNLLRPARISSLGLVLLTLLASLGIGLAIKAPCVGSVWTGQQYTKLCYTDIIPLYGTEQLQDARLPFLQPCEDHGIQCDEYPVGTMYAMRVAAWGSNSPGSFFALTTVFLAIAAVSIAVCLYLIVGRRALFFTLAPTLIIYAFTNWDLYAVALATGATLLYLRKRGGWAGVLMGLGVAMKFYPILLLLPFILGRFADDEPDGGIHFAWGAIGAWIAVNLPFAVASPGSWATFFTFNAQRAPDWDSLWFIGCHRATGDLACPLGMTGLVGIVSGATFLGSVALIWFLKIRREPSFPRWQIGFAILVVFLLTSKVYSPQYGLWLLPWFALVMPELRFFIAFEVADIAVFVTRFSFFGELTDVGGLSFGWFEIAIIARAVILVACVIAWMRRPSETLPITSDPPTRAADVAELVDA